MVWIYDDIGDSYQQTQYRSLIRLTKNEKIARDGSRMLGLFNYLKTNKFEDWKNLRESVFFDKKKTKHFFTEANAQKTFDFLTKKQQGGSDGALDHLINRWFNFVYSIIPINIRESFVDPPVNFINVFTLNNLEQIPVFGRSLAFSIDVALAINKNVAKMLQQYMPMAVGYTPIPFGALIGTVIGYVMSAFFIFINELIYVSRHNFGEAWTQSLAFLPVIGTALQNWAESGDKLLEKFADKRKYIIDDLNKSPMFSWMGNIIENYTFDLTSDGALPTSAGKRLSTKRSKKDKWRTRRQRSAKY
jgi:hypothetical protein